MEDHDRRGQEIRCRYYIMATGCLSMPKSPDIEGAGRFAGQVYFTSRWPHEGVDFTGQRVAVIGTGSSGIQSIPLIARQASQLTVFQRTPNFSIPAHNGPAPADRLEQLEQDRDGYRDAARWSRGGVPVDPTDILGGTASEAVRRERFEAAWEQGELFGILNVFADQGVNPASNEIVAEMIREKIRSTVKDPGTAEALCPKDHYFGTKRPCLDTGYFETYNLPHVRLIDLRKQPIVSITEDGIETADESFGFDAIVYATGFDAMTGALVAADVAGRDGLSLKEKWAAGPSTYLGLMTAGFPNFFMLTGPGSPSVLSNMTVSIEQHVDWVAGCLKDMRGRGFGDDRADRAGRIWLGPARPGLRRHHLVSHRQLLVHGRQRSRQAARIPALHRRGGRVPAGVRRGGLAGLPRIPDDRSRRGPVPGRGNPQHAARRRHGPGDRWPRWACRPWKRCRPPTRGP